MRTLILLIGLPQSGKSTWAKEQGYPIVNRDSIRYALGDSIRYFKEEDRVTEIERIMVKSLFKAGHEKVIVDATHLKKKYIQEWEEFATNPIWRPFRDEDETLERNFQIYKVPFFTSVEECIDRAKVNFPKEENFPNVILSMWENVDIDHEIPRYKVHYGESG